MDVQFYMKNTQATGAGEASASGAVHTELPACLTAEGLLTYCQTMVGSVEEEINALMEEQMRNMTRKSAISKVEGEMKAHTPPKTDADLKAIEKAFDEAIESLPKGDPTRKALEDLKAEVLGQVEASKRPDFKPTGGVGFHEVTVPLPEPTYKIAISKESWQGLIDKATNLKEEVSDNMQMGMLILQSKVSAYQTQFQLASNMTSSVNKTGLAIANNVRS